MATRNKVLVSIVIPACAAQSTIARAVRSLVHQTWPAWEAIVIADDGEDYAALLSAQGIRDNRLRFASTGRFRSGCHHARNVGLGMARGDLIGALDADDLFHRGRIAALAPLAAKHGAAVDNIAVVIERTGAVLYRAIGDAKVSSRLTVEELLRLSVPLFPLVRHDHAEMRLPGIEFADDVVSNLRLIDRLGSLLIVPDTLSEYRVRTGSMCHNADSATMFDRAYADLIARLQDEGDGLGLRPAARSFARQGLAAKRALNRAFGIAQRDDPSLNFQTFVAARSEAARRSLASIRGRPLS
jgi:succinoglycan biosynthesis protein ExoO